MVLRLIDLAKWLFPLGPRKRRFLKEMRAHLTKEEYADAHYLARLRRVGFHEQRLGTTVIADRGWPQLSSAVDDEKLVTFVTAVNRKIEYAAKLAAFREFKTVALEKVAALVAPNIVGMDAAKRAAALQLFAQEPVHVLLLGDPGTGKTEILHGLERLAPHAVFGLGSGASKAGLTGVYDGNAFKPGLLVEADDGLALIDELNLLKKEDRAGLYSAMEKGFITYDKKGKHERHDARVRILATANPKGDRFVGRDVKFLKTQLPFDDALLSRFHLLFFIRKPSKKELEVITRKIVRQAVVELEDGDSRFVKEYALHAEKLIVQFADTYEAMIVDFIENLKREERNYLVEVGPRTVIGVIRIAKAFARARLARNVSADDLESAMKLIKDALTIG